MVDCFGLTDLSVGESTCLVYDGVCEGWFGLVRRVGGVVMEEVELLLVLYFIGSNVADWVSVTSLNRIKVRQAMQWYR